jgi:hypothetical protein
VALMDPFLMASLKLKVVVLEAVFFPPLPVIVKVGVVDMIYFPIIGFYKSTKISDLKDQVDIDGSGFDVVLTSWNVSHVSDASKAFYNHLKF